MGKELVVDVVMVDGEDVNGILVVLDDKIFEEIKVDIKFDDLNWLIEFLFFRMLDDFGIDDDELDGKFKIFWLWFFN